MTAVQRRPLILGPDRIEGPFGDAYRALRLTVCRPNGERPPVTVLVASASADEGRTTTVANLGITSGRAGSRVILIDADFYNPSLHQLLEEGRAASDGAPARGPSGSPPGLAEVIRDGASFGDLMVKAPFPGVWLLPAGADLGRPSELVTSPLMGEMLRQVREHAELVLIDSPACLEHVDAVELAAHVDAVLYVVRAGDQDRSAQRQVQAQLRHSPARMLGAVLNRA
ncbi:MAG: CpsD/CapB family tyrosine-protein kinase [Candidatus Dormibacteraeota bacterium]|nr:CpsD/CapB family tyrosine-protein kinase [Candidatus Dormibacteraeota bacterium]